jgi:hypothetical protein
VSDDDAPDMLDHFREDQIRGHMMGQRIMGLEAEFDRYQGDTLTLKLGDGTAVVIKAKRIRLALARPDQAPGAPVRRTFLRRARR